MVSRCVLHLLAKGGLSVDNNASASSRCGMIAFFPCFSLLEETSLWATARSRGFYLKGQKDRLNLVINYLMNNPVVFLVEAVSRASCTKYLTIN